MISHLSRLKALDRKKSGAFIIPRCQEGGDDMARKKTIEELLAEREKAEQNLKLQQEKLRQLLKKEAELVRNARTHRLCTHGAMLEQYLPPDEYPDELVDRILRVIFRRNDILDMVQNMKRQMESQGGSS